MPEDNIHRTEYMNNFFEVIGAELIDVAFKDGDGGIDHGNDYWSSYVWNEEKQTHEREDDGKIRFTKEFIKNFICDPKSFVVTFNDNSSFFEDGDSSLLHETLDRLVSEKIITEAKKKKIVEKLTEERYVGLSDFTNTLQDITGLTSIYKGN